jgi:hypothetical protein
MTQRQIPLATTIVILAMTAAGCRHGTKPGKGSDGSVATDAGIGSIGSLADGSVLGGADSNSDGASSPLPRPTPVLEHPRLFFTSRDLSRLQSWATPSNPVYAHLADVATRAKADMDKGMVPAQDNGGVAYTPYATESYAELFAFLSLISTDKAARADWGQRARTLIMYAMNLAAQGTASGTPFRDPRFSTDDRSRWTAEGFPLAVDWAYPYFSAQDKATIRTVFLRWIHEMVETDASYHHPQPIGVLNDPVLIQDKQEARWATNNYFAAHLRNIGLLALTLDGADDPDGTLRGYLSNATGAWLYITDHLMRTDIAGGLPPEGWEYGPQSMAYVAQLLLALHTAGVDDASIYGQQVVLKDHPFWDAYVPGFLSSLGPVATTSRDPNLAYLGPGYLPAHYGDAQHLFAPDPIASFGPLGLYDQAILGTSARLDAVRYFALHMGQGGDGGLATRMGDPAYLHAIFYFLLLNPAASPNDPRPGLAKDFFAPGIGRIHSRTDASADARWFTFQCGWQTVDHQHATGNQFELYRKGEWLAQECTGYGTEIGCSDAHNTLCLENDRPAHDDELRTAEWQHKSQWRYIPSGDGTIVAHSFTPNYVYALGDATNLYNSAYEGSTDIVHASRSIVWLKPDYVVVYDRAVSQTDQRAKQFWLCLPGNGTVPPSSNTLTMTTPGGQKLFVQTLLPAGNAAAISVDMLDPKTLSQEVESEGIQTRLHVEAVGGPKNVRFLHVLEGADGTASVDAASLVQSSGGTAFDGAVVNGSVVLFPVDLSASFTSLSYSVPAATRAHLVTGLSPGAAYTVTKTTVGSSVQVMVTKGGSRSVDSGGVLSF